MAFEGDLQKFTPVEVDEVGQIILKARELLSDPAKWCKGYHTNAGAYCILGAIGARDWNDGADEEVIERIESALPLLFRLRAYVFDSWSNLKPAVAAFNDAPSTTHADILALLDRAASAHRRGE
jgi:hypothetical protein